MWTLSAAVFLLCFTGYWCHGCNLTKPYFKSRNFNSVLHWHEVNIPGEVVLFSVEYHKYGEPYKPVFWCQNISVPLCDLTSVMTEVAARYYAKITGAGQCLGELMFTPYEQTILEAPKLSVWWNETLLNVTISAPMGPENQSMENISCWGICKNPMKYTVNLTQPKSAAGRVFEGTSDSVLVWPVETETEYCGDVVYSLTHPSSPRQSHKASFCVTVQGRNSWFFIVLLPGLLAVILLIVIPVVLCQQSVRRKHSWPRALKLSKSNTLPFYPDAWDDISKLRVCSGFVGSSQKVDLQASIAQKRSKVMGNWADYAPQDSHDLQRRPSEELVHCSSHTTEQSVNYSMIVGVKPSEEPSADAGGHKTSSVLSAAEFVWAKKPHSVLMGPDSSSKPLVVPVITAENGLLQLNEALLQHGSETDALSEGSALLGERTLLLTNLTEEDLRCNATYLPVDVSAASCSLSLVTSNYRKNWLPGLTLEEQRTYILRSDHLQETTEAQEKEEEEKDLENEEESKVTVTPLDRWMLKMEA